jgi:hypothetical protein
LSQIFFETARVDRPQFLIVWEIAITYASVVAPRPTALFTDFIAARILVVLLIRGRSA